MTSCVIKKHWFGMSFRKSVLNKVAEYVLGYIIDLFTSVLCVHYFTVIETRWLGSQTIHSSPAVLLNLKSLTLRFFCSEGSCFVLTSPE